MRFVSQPWLILEWVTQLVSDLENNIISGFILVFVVF